MFLSFVARRGPEAINIEIVERHVNKISQLEKIPKKKKSEPEGQVLNELFESTMYEHINFLISFEQNYVYL